MYILWKNVYPNPFLSFNQIVFLLMNFKNSLYILFINSLSDTWYVNLVPILGMTFLLFDDIGSTKILL